MKKICDIHPSSFNPPPRVYSSLISFTPLSLSSRLDLKTEKTIENLLKVTFNARRKKLRNTLSSVFSKENISNLEKQSEINFNLRPQDISIEKWIKLAKLCNTISS